MGLYLGAAVEMPPGGASGLGEKEERGDFCCPPQRPPGWLC
jgi:hypothetical protein